MRKSLRRGERQPRRGRQTVLARPWQIWKGCAGQPNRLRVPQPSPSPARRQRSMTRQPDQDWRVNCESSRRGLRGIRLPTPSRLYRAGASAATRFSHSGAQDAMKARSVADIVGPWVNPDFDSGLIERCRKAWDVPIDKMLATFLRQDIATDWILDEAYKRLEVALDDDSEIYEGELAATVQYAGERRARRSCPIAISRMNS